MKDSTDYRDERLPTRLRGQIRATELQLKYVKEMGRTPDSGLRLGLTEAEVELEDKLEVFRSEARRLLFADNHEAAAVAGAPR